MSDEPETDRHDDRGDEQPETLDDAREQLHVLRRELSRARKESATRRRRIRELEQSGSEVETWRTLAVQSLVQAEAAAAGARRPELVGRLVDLGELDGDALDEIRSNVREQVEQTLEANPELRAERAGGGLVTQGVRSRGYHGRRSEDPDAWLRKSVRRGGG
jgi:hypothetical protein